LLILILMKKFLPLFLLSLTVLLLFSGVAQASVCPEFKTSLVPCGQKPDCPCELLDLFEMIGRVYYFFVWDIATPLAGLMIVVGGVMLLVSGGNPGLAGRAKNIIKWSIIAILLIFGSWLIIDFVLKAIGYTRAGNWSAF